MVVAAAQLARPMTTVVPSWNSISSRLRGVFLFVLFSEYISSIDSNVAQIPGHRAHRINPAGQLLL